MVKHTDRHGTLLDAYEYEYDIAGNLTKETSQCGTTTYVYDADRRLQSVTEPEGKTTTYSYDMAGNRARKEVSNPGSEPIVTEYTYNVSNQLLKQHTSDGTVTEYIYDANGNLISEECTVLLDSDAVTGSAIQVASITLDEPEVETSSEAISGSAIESPTESVTGSAIRYTYDAFNRLTQYETDDVLALYSYNAEDYRVGKTILDDSGAKNVLYFYEGSRVILEADEAGNITAHNLYGTNLISRSVQGESYCYLYNAHGDVVMLMDTATGAVAATYRYDAFGNVIAQTGNPDNSITYAGYQYDEESGLYYLNARYYDSSTARFLTEDTYRGRQQDPLSLHRYTYCMNDPLKYYDPSGHTSVSVEAEFGWLREVDGPYPYGDILFLILSGWAILSESECFDIPIKFVGEPYSGPSPETGPHPAPQNSIEFVGEPYSGSSPETGLHPAPYPAPQPAPQNNISVYTGGGIGTIVDPAYDGMKSGILWFPIENDWMHVLTTPQYDGETTWVLKDPVIENSGPQIMVDPIPYDTSIHIYQSNKEADKSNGGGTGSGAHQSGSSSTELKDVFNSIKDSPKYPEGFQPRANGTTNNKVNNQQLLEKLREIESGTWKKIYKDGYDAYGNKISIHYFQSQSGKVFDVKVKSGWSN